MIQLNERGDLVEVEGEQVPYEGEEWTRFKVEVIKTAEQLAEAGLAVVPVSEYEALCKMAQTKWQPIESAPKDGTEILVLMPLGVRHVLVRWTKPNSANWGDRYGNDRDLSAGWCAQGVALDRRNGNPLGWMPLPAPPQESE